MVAGRIVNTCKISFCQCWKFEYRMYENFQMFMLPMFYTSQFSVLQIFEFYGFWNSKIFNCRSFELPNFQILKYSNWHSSDFPNFRPFELSNFFVFELSFQLSKLYKLERRFWEIFPRKMKSWKEYFNVQSSTSLIINLIIFQSLDLPIIKDQAINKLQNIEAININQAIF